VLGGALVVLAQRRGWLMVYPPASAAEPLAHQPSCPLPEPVDHQPPAGLGSWLVNLGLAGLAWWGAARRPVQLSSSESQYR
jgi:hypothetical protein